MLAKKVARLVEENQLWQANDRLLLAVSTGVDSMVLMHVLETLSVPFGVVHVNHQLREASYQEALFLTEYCQQRQIPLYQTRWEQPAITGVEAAARQFRYTFFQQIMTQYGYSVLLTAHHSDDQMETILMKLVREGNFFSSSGIRLSQAFGEGMLIRPLLTTTKAEILAYSQTNGVPYFEDETNFSLDMQRNRLRHHVVPFLQAENPQVHHHFQQWSNQTIWAQEIIAEQQQQWLERLVTVDQQGYHFDLADYFNLSEAKRYFFLQALKQQLQIEEQIGFTEKQIQQAMQLFSGPAQGTVMLAKQWHIKKTYQQITIAQKVKEKITGTQFRLKIGEAYFLSEEEWIGIFPIGEEKIPEKVKFWSEYRQDLSVNFPFVTVLRKRQSGDKIALNRHLTKKIRRFFIDKKIPNEKREQAWVLTTEQEEVLGLIPYAFSYLSIAKETDKIHYVLLYRRMKETNYNL